MGRYNLLHEPWIKVILNDESRNKETLSLISLFDRAHEIKQLSGETKSQDFAVLRILLAVLHTVFSRFNAEGKEYGYFDLDERFKQITLIDEEDVSSYKNDLFKTWLSIWNNQKFPDIIKKYLMKWEDRFYLYDENYPVFQVNKDFISENPIEASGKITDKPTLFWGKNINRLISESENKIAMFSPKNVKNKNKIEDAELVRWLITLHGYTSTSDKTKFAAYDIEGAVSAGWLFDIGGVFIKGNNLFETLMLNFVIQHNEKNNLSYKQSPCWEESSYEFIKTIMSNRIDNLSSLYTVWSRAIIIDINSKPIDKRQLFVVKLRQVEHENNFLEPMMIFEKKKNSYFPKKHQKDKLLWRSFGLLGNLDNGRTVGVIDWLSKISKVINETKVRLVAIGLEDDKTASHVPTYEIYDELFVSNVVLTDFSQEGWFVRINKVVKFIETFIEKDYKMNFINRIEKLRSIKNGRSSKKEKSYSKNSLSRVYNKVDIMFNSWLNSVNSSDNKDDKEIEIKIRFLRIMKECADEVLSNSTFKDLNCNNENSLRLNIFEIYNRLTLKINSLLKSLEG